MFPLLFVFSPVGAQLTVEWYHEFILNGASGSYSPFATDAGRKLISGVNNGRNGVNFFVGGINTAIDNFPNNPIITPPDTLRRLDQWNPDSTFTISFGQERLIRRYLSVGKYFNGGRIAFLFGGSHLVGKKAPMFGAEFTLYPIEIFKRKSFGMFNMSRLIYIQSRTTFDLGNPTLLESGFAYGGNVDISLLGNMLRVGAYYKKYKELNLPYKPKSILIATNSFGVYLGLSLNGQTYDQKKDIPLYAITGGFIELRWSKFDAYVPFLDKVLKDATNTALSVTEDFTRLVNQVADKVNISTGLSENLARQEYDSVPAYSDRSVYTGYQVGLGYDERWASTTIIWRQSKKANIRMNVGLYPLGWMKPRQMFRVSDKVIYLDMRKIVEVGGFVDHDRNIDRKYRGLFMKGIYAKVGAPLMISHKSYLKPSLGYSRIKTDRAKITALSVDLTFSYSFSETESFEKDIVKLSSKRWKKKSSKKRKKKRRKKKKRRRK